MLEAPVTANAAHHRNERAHAWVAWAAQARAATVALAGLLLVVAVLSFWRLDRSPRTWFDEGSYLLAARSLAEGRGYAAYSADGTRDYAPVIGVGPTLLVPTAAVIRAAGPDLAAARLVPALYLVVTTVVVALVCRALFGAWAGLASLGILLVMPALDWVASGRQVLGETPAFLYLLLGGVVAACGRSLPAAAAAGALLGLAMVTKGQYVIVLPTAVLLLVALDRGPDRRAARWYALLCAAMGAIYAGWLAMLVLLIGDGHVIENIRLLRQSSGGAVVVFDPQRMLAALKLLLGPRTLFLPYIAFAYALWATRRASGDRRRALLLLAIFQFTWMAWFVGASIGWPRYAFPALAVSAMLAGPLAVMAARVGWRHWRRLSAGRRIVQPLGVGLVALLVGAGALALAVRELSPVARADERSANRFAAEVALAVPDDARVAGWEPEIGFLSGIDLVYPPNGSLDRVVRARWLGQPATLDLGANLTTDYVIVGPFGRWVGVYDSAIASSRYVPVLQVGEYQLFVRVH